MHPPDSSLASPVQLQSALGRSLLNGASDRVLLICLSALLASVDHSTNGDYQHTEVSVVHDGTSAYFTQYGTITTDTSELATFGVDINISNIIVKICV